MTGTTPIEPFRQWPTAPLLLWCGEGSYREGWELYAPETGDNKIQFGVNQEFGIALTVEEATQLRDALDQAIRTVRQEPNR